MSKSKLKNVSNGTSIGVQPSAVQIIIGTDNDTEDPGSDQNMSSIGGFQTLSRQTIN